jgi:hypothetical protein
VIAHTEAGSRFSLAHATFSHNYLETGCNDFVRIQNRTILGASVAGVVSVEQFTLTSKASSQLLQAIASM